MSGLWAAADQPALPYTEAPPTSLEVGPNQPAPGDGSQWISGCWLPRDDRWFWRPGFWVGPRPGWVFTPPRHCWTPRGYLFVGGFWDRDLQTRGLPFAPVLFPPSLYAAPNFMYTPRHALNVGACLNSLWARPGWNYYAFGDYYGPAYGSLGFQPWFLFGPRVGCPLFGYYRQLNFWRNPNWASGLAATHQGRLNGTLPLPPRTFAAQAKLGNPTGATLVPLASYRNPSLPLVRTPLADRAVVERVTSAYLRAGGDRSREELRPAPGGARPGSLPLATMPTPPAPAPSAVRSGELPRPSPPLTRPAPRATPQNIDRTPTFPPPREALRSTAPMPSLPPAAVPRFSTPAPPRFTLPPPRINSQPGRPGGRR
ncbi:MAG: hypothetical protein U0797_04115 [Gemmataceae bacterium]